MPPTDIRLSPHGLTPKEVSRLLRVGQEKVRNWIKVGALNAVDVGHLGRPRYVVLPEHLEAFVKARSAAPPPRAPRRRKQKLVTFYPD
jgi:excisionase family DNA binding protein